MERLRKYINCVSDANNKALSIYERITRVSKYSERESIINDSAIMQWVQIWNDTSCGFGDIGGAAMTPADTIIVECIHYGIAFVYHSGMFAYACETDLDYRTYVNFRNFPGKLDAERGNFNFEDNKLKLIDIDSWEK